MKNKKVVILIAIIILLILVVVGIIFLKREKTSPEEILNEYMSFIEKKDYEAMYNLVTANTPKEDYINRNKNIYEGIEANSINISVAKTNKSGSTVEVIYTTSMNTVAGDISFSNTAYLECEQLVITDISI